MFYLILLPLLCYGVTLESMNLVHGMGDDADEALRIHREDTGDHTYREYLRFFAFKEKGYITLQIQER